MKPFRRILVPVDFSEHSQQALRVAGEMARRFEASVDVVHVYNPVAYPLPEGYALFTREQLDRMFAEFDELLQEMKTVAKAAGAARVETHLRQGVVAQDICEYAAAGGFDLIVMGTHGRTGLSHVFLGSTTERVLRAAPCPVLSVRAQPAESLAAGVKSGEGREVSACCGP